MRTRQVRRVAPAVTTAVGCVLASLALAGCSTIGDAGTDVPSNGPIPATPPTVSGPAILGTATGHGGAGATVTVTVVLRSSEQAWRDAKAIFSLGLGCLDAQGCTAPSAHGIVAANGNFAVAVPHGLTDKDGLAVTVEATRGTDSRVATTLLLPPSAANGATVSVPLATDPAVLGVSANRARLRPPSVAGASTTGGTVAMDHIDANNDSRPVADATETDVSSGFDIRLLEDGKAMLVSHQSGSVNGLPAEYSSSLVVTGHAIPGSRGAGCAVEGSDGAALPQHPCELTNGAVDQQWQPQDDPACTEGPCPGTLQNNHRDVTVLLPKPIDATLLVVRGCGFTCQVQVSADGRNFGPFSGPPRDSTDSEYVETLPGLPVASVRVETATGGFFDSLQQVSVFS
jgi:hypothetical protein